jgi:hypothetical protein
MASRLDLTAFVRTPRSSIPTRFGKSRNLSREKNYAIEENEVMPLQPQE